MTEYTNRLHLAKPDFNVSGWHDDVNDNFTILDAVVFAATNLTIAGIWENSTAYVVGERVIDADDGVVYTCLINNTSPAAPTTFEDDRVAHPTYWGVTDTGITFKGAWITATAYTPGDHVYHLSEHVTAVCIAGHTSAASIRTDITGGKWALIADLKADVEAIANAGSIGLITPTDGTFIVGDGSVFVGESGATARTSMGVGTGSTVSFTSLGIGNTSPQESLHVGAGTDASSETDAVAIFTKAGATSIGVRDSTNNVEAIVRANSGGADVGSVTNHSFRVYTNNVLRGTFNTSGDLTMTGTVVGQSSRNTKKDFADIESPLSKVLQLQGLYYTDKETEQRRVGFVLEDFRLVIPELTNEDGIAYGNVTALLVEAVKELYWKIDDHSSLG